jgi:signal transduction histidine kinase/ligand-binding sensor domain-containing protein
LFIAAAVESYGAQPVVRLFTTDDGLVRNYVTRIRRDRAGRLWFCTVEGISVFDGERFTGYTVADGLPNRVVTDFLDTGEGVYWIVTHAGLFRFQMRRGRRPAPVFQQVPLEGAKYPLRYPTKGEAVLFETRSGEICLGTGEGLYRIETRVGRPHGVMEPLPWSAADQRDVRAIVEDRKGDLWFLAGERLVRRHRDGRLTSWSFRLWLPGGASAQVLMEDRDGRLWLGSENLCVLDTTGETPERVALYRSRDIPPLIDVQSLFQDERGDVWAGGFGLAHLEAGVWRTFNPGSLLGSQNIASIAADTQGHLWMAAGNVGAARILQHGFSTFTEEDGLESKAVISIFETGDGKLYAVTGARHDLNEFDGHRFRRISPRLPLSIESAGWGESSVMLKDRRGEWWTAIGEGTVRFPRVRSAADLAHTPPKAVYGRASGLSFSPTLRVFEDTKGGIWASGLGAARWDAKAERFNDFTPALRELIGQTPLPLSFVEDHAGQIWIGLDVGGLVRLRAGRLERVQDGVPGGAINGLLIDHSGRLWMTSTQGGLGRMDEPSAASPRVRRYTDTEGLASSQLFAVTEDHTGRIYIAGGQGVDRLDSATGAVRHYLTSDGLPPGETTHLYCDRQGAIWFGSLFGLSRYEPESEQPAGPAAPAIHSVRVAGVPIMLSDEGEHSITGLDLPRGKDDIEIAYGSVDFSMGHSPKYQYRLLPVDKEWRKPTVLSSVQYARLGPAQYTFEVRGVNSSGVVSEQAATVAFRIPPPLWLRWWFLSAAGVSMAGIAFAAHAYRLAHVMALQRIRTRLASDLHDDLGSGLAEIAILAEVAKQQDGSNGVEVMSTVAERARELRGTMGDIVWSVDPARDNLTDVIRRWRQAAVGLLGGVSLAFTAPPEAVTDAVNVPPDRRRHLLLLFKEAVTNVARHARAAHVTIQVMVDGGQLHVWIRDDGCGFAPANVPTGNGLRSLAHRAKELNGKLEIHSAPQRGTTVELRLPVDVN